MKSPRHWALQPIQFLFYRIVDLGRNEKPETLGTATITFHFHIRM